MPACSRRVTVLLRHWRCAQPGMASGVETLALPDAKGRVDLPGLMRSLAGRGVNELHVEGGARLNGALMAGGHVDELLLYVAPSALGDPARGMFELDAPLTSLAARIRSRGMPSTASDSDLRLIARVVRQGRVMFTGIVQAVGRIERAVPQGDGVQVTRRDAASLDASDIAVGDSVGREWLLPDGRRAARQRAGVRRLGGNAPLHDRAWIARATSTSKSRCGSPIGWAVT